jgi:hypothetical protein
MSALALYIPCVYKNITEEMIAQTFYRLKVGSVLHVELVPHTEKYNKAHVFFESLYPFGKGADQIQQVNNGETVKLQYSKSEHVFWLLMLNNREYDGVSRKGWYDVESEEKKKADAEIAAIVANVNAVNTQESVQDQDQDQDQPIVQYFAQENEESESFGLVSCDYAQSLETEIARLQAELRNANDIITENQRPLQDTDPTENQMLSLRRENYALRWGYDNMYHIKMPPSPTMPPPVLERVSPYAGGSMEYGTVVYDEIARITRDNITLLENINVLSCMPDSVMREETGVVSDYDYDESDDEEDEMDDEEY